MTIATTSVSSEATDEELRLISKEFEAASPEVVLGWAIEEFGEDVALATGFGAEGCVLIDMLARIDRRANVFYLDTGLLFPETYQLRDQLEARYGIAIERRAATLSLQAQAAELGDSLWQRQPNECCRLRKIEPLLDTLAGLKAWITAIRRDQSPARAGAAVVERDKKFGLIKINPLAAWSSKDVWNYISKHDVPYNALHNQGYPSIGCAPCTSFVRIGEDSRAGRWRGTSKTECGLHT